VSGGLLAALGARQQPPGLSSAAVGWDDVLGLPRTLAGPLWVVLALWVLAALGAFVLGRAGHRHVSGHWAILIGWVLGPLFVVTTLGLSGSFFEPRYAAAIAPAVAVLAALGLVTCCTRLSAPFGTLLVAGALTALLGGLLPSAWASRSSPYYSDDPRTAAASLATRVTADDAVVFNGRTARGLTSTYWPDGVLLNDVLATATPEESNSIDGREVSDAVRVTVLDPHPRVWMIGTRSHGSWSDAEKALDVTEGRRLEHREQHGQFWLELWSRR
jgi:hypothetical protein